MTLVLIAPIKTEKAVGKVEFENALTFEIAGTATRADVKKEVEKLFAVKVANVNTYVTSRGKKRAVVRLAKGSKAEDITTKLKMVA